MNYVAILRGVISGRFSIGRPGAISSFSGNIGDLSIRFITTATPYTRAAKPPLTGGEMRIGDHRVHRLIFDSEAHTYFGFDMLLDSTDTSKVHHVAFEPLSVGPHERMPRNLIAAKTGWANVPLAEVPPPQTLELGRTLALGLTTADGKHKVVERIRLKKLPYM
jgi:hypothetical protein